MLNLFAYLAKFVLNVMVALDRFPVYSIYDL
jgi:hypothetical protein